MFLVARLSIVPLANEVEPLTSNNTTRGSPAFVLAGKLYVKLSVDLVASTMLIDFTENS